MTLRVHAVRVRSEPGVRERGDRKGPSRVDRGRVGRGWGRGCRERRGRRGGREAVDDTLMLGGLEGAAQEDMLPLEGEEEGSVALVDLAGRFRHVVRGGEARGDVGHGRAVSGEGVELRAASLLDLGEAPVVGARGAEGHDEGDGGPQVVDRGAANLCVRVRARARAARRLSQVTCRAVTSGSEASTQRAGLERPGSGGARPRSAPPWQLSHVILAGDDATGPPGPVRAPPAEESRDASSRDQQVRGVGAKSGTGPGAFAARPAST